MLVDKPCDLETALHSGLPASAADSITPFVLAGLKAAWAQALKTCASQGPPIALASTGASSSEAATISSWSDAFPAKLSATFTKEIRLRFESSYPVNYWTTVVCIRVAYWHWPTVTRRIAPTSSFHGSCGFPSGLRKN